MEAALLMNINYYICGSISCIKSPKGTSASQHWEEYNITSFPKGEEIHPLFYLDGTAKTAPDFI